MKVTKWIVGKAVQHQTEGMVRYVTRDAEPCDIARHIVKPYNIAQYLDMTQAWRPLDIHPDWRTWEGATTQTKGSK